MVSPTTKVGKTVPASLRVRTKKVDPSRSEITVSPSAFWKVVPDKTSPASARFPDDSKSETELMVLLATIVAAIRVSKGPLTVVNSLSKKSPSPRASNPKSPTSLPLPIRPSTTRKELLLLLWMTRKPLSVTEAEISLFWLSAN